MKYLELSLPTPEANLACDEVLLDLCESGAHEGALRLWESPVVFVVIGYSNRAAREVNEPACRARRIPVLRRCSGGGTVVQGPGCLNYTLCLQVVEGGPLDSITQTNSFIMSRHRDLFQRLLNRPVDIRGHTDLAVDEKKFSGNAQRRKQRSVLFHGTFLLDFDLSLVEQLLPLPSQQPAYRAARAHRDFLRNLHLPAEAVRQGLRDTWKAHEPFTRIIEDRTNALVESKYSRAEWNGRF